jgi:hypothetical protein
VRSLERTYELLESADTLFAQLEPYISAFYRAWETESSNLLPANYEVNTR